MLMSPTQRKKTDCYIMLIAHQPIGFKIKAYSEYSSINRVTASAIIFMRYRQ